MAKRNKEFTDRAKLITDVDSIFIKAIHKVNKAKITLVEQLDLSIGALNNQAREIAPRNAQTAWRNIEETLSVCREILEKNDITQADFTATRLKELHGKLPKTTDFTDHFDSGVKGITPKLVIYLPKVVQALNDWKTNQRRILALVGTPTLSAEERANGEGPRNSQTSATVLGAAVPPVRGNEA